MYVETSRLKELKVDNQIQMSDIVYNPMSQVTQLKTGASTGNADIEQYSYDAQTGLLTNQKVIKQNNSQTLLDLSYNYNRGNSNGSLNGKTGQLTQITDNLNANKNRSYEFDALGRLRFARGGAPGVSANWTQSYTFDRYGNRTNVQASGVTQNNQPVPTDGLPNMSYDQTSNRIINTNYEFDQAGNQTRGQAPNGQLQRFDFDAAGRLVKIKDDSGNIIESYTYGASRQRLKTVNGAVSTYYAWGGSSVLCEYSETTGNPASFKFSKSYIYAGSRLLSTQTWNGTTEITEFHHPDRTGTKLVTNNQANTSYEQSTLPFGTALNAESTGFSSQVFTSYERSAGTGLDYAQNRFYNPGQGRFTTVDPIGMNSGSITDPQSNNLFAYTQNNPIDFTDPSGLFQSEPKPQQPDWGALWNLIFGHEQMHTFSDPDTGGSGGNPCEDIKAAKETEDVDFSKGIPKNPKTGSPVPSGVKIGLPGAEKNTPGGEIATFQQMYLEITIEFVDQYGKPFASIDWLATEKVIDIEKSPEVSKNPPTLGSASMRFGSIVDRKVLTADNGYKELTNNLKYVRKQIIYAENDYEEPKPIAYLILTTTIDGVEVIDCSEGGKK